MRYVEILAFTATILANDALAQSKNQASPPPPRITVQQAPQIQQPNATNYTFKQTTYGTVQVFQNGQLISTGTPQNAVQRYGYQGSVTSQGQTAPVQQSRSVMPTFSSTFQPVGGETTRQTMSTMGTIPTGSAGRLQFAPISQSSTQLSKQQPSGQAVSNSAPQYQPISQMSINNFSGPMSRTYMAETCLATVYTMVERSIPGKGAVPINNFYNVNQGAILPSNLTRGSLNSNLMTLQNGPQLLVIIGTAKTMAGAQVSHYMLGTSVNEVGGIKAITAIDPYSGVQVTINASTGKVIQAPSNYAQIDFNADAFRTLAVNPD